VNASTWSWLSRRIEFEVIKKALEHLDKIMVVAELSYEVFRAFKNNLKDEVKSIYEKVYEAEKEADEIKRSIIRELGKGFIHPIDREELIRLILTNDDIATYLKAATRRAILADPNDIDPKVKDYVISMVERVVKSVKYLREAIASITKDPRKSLELADSVERLEEEVDDLRIKALAYVLRFCDESKPSACIVAKEIVDSVENSEDKCEDAADVVRSIVVLRA